MSRLEREFRTGAAEQLAPHPAGTPLLDEAALASLPALVREYVERSGAIGRPVVRNFRAVSTGDMRCRLFGPHRLTPHSARQIVASIVRSVASVVL